MEVGNDVGTTGLNFRVFPLDQPRRHVSRTCLGFSLDNLSLHSRQGRPRQVDSPLTLNRSSCKPKSRNQPRNQPRNHRNHRNQPGPQAESQLHLFVAAGAVFHSVLSSQRDESRAVSNVSSVELRLCFAKISDQITATCDLRKMRFRRCSRCFRGRLKDVLRSKFEGNPAILESLYISMIYIYIHEYIIHIYIYVNDILLRSRVKLPTILHLSRAKCCLETPPFCRICCSFSWPKIWLISVACFTL